ncbi:hypothetical protein [Haliangium ochraceum]|uniref:Ribbon-helix-helix protein CopG domain-containing protein n=1 Tax=Haliangium ochraceum (strain DSM 14365 / JCM 11303 / SMP-2) TaxID=502025 RepID=D0LQP8_HALO1|nr:hypothetical protein [Haliangium ochraceum]ACY13608.1 conserved hypothetical protein [Haliangium ochraceum DSM 14365]
MNRKNKKRIESIKALRLPEIWEQFEEIVGESTRCPNKKYLLRRITESLEAQEQAAADAAAEAAEAEPATDTAPGAEPEETEESADAEEGEEGEEGEDAAAPRKLTKLSVAELQQVYAETVGRPTGSSHKRYLVWKIREAQKGRVRVGPVTRGRPAGEPGAEHKILPLRMEAETVEALDDAWRRHGLKSRMDFFRHALGSYLASLGEDEVAERVQAG